MEMEIDEDIINYILDENQKIERNHQNSKIMNNQTYQNEEILKIKSDYNKFYENQEIQNNCINCLASCSNFIFYSSDNNCNSIYEARHTIKNNLNKVFEKEKNNDINDDFKKELNESKNKIFKEKFKDNDEYKNLCELINQKDFDEKMKKDEDFRISIFLNKFFLYNEKSQEIINRYSSLVPNYIYNIIKEKIEGNNNNSF